MTSRTAILWLKIAIEAQLLLGAAMVLIGVPIVGSEFAMLVNLVVDPGGPVAEFTREGRLLAVIGGGILIGWAALAWHVTTTQIEAGDARGVRALMVSVLVWFAADSAGSLVAGVPLNAAANLVYLVLFLPPLIALMRGQRVAISA